MDAFPLEAEALIVRIEAMLADALAQLVPDATGEVAFALRETRRRYLPDTLKAYAQIPPAQRDAAAVRMLLEQLRILEVATAQRVSALAADTDRALAANGRFLRKRFADAAATTQSSAGEAASSLRGIAQVVGDLDLEGASNAAAALERAAAQLDAAIPELLTTQRSGLLAHGPILDITVDVPRPDDVRRFVARCAGPRRIETTVARRVRGVMQKQVALDPADWKRELAGDLTAYAKRRE